MRFLWEVRILYKGFKGYNDIFIPNMKRLSPEYKKYHDVLTAMNPRICSELGLYYDTDFNLVRK